MSEASPRPSLPAAGTPAVRAAAATEPTPAETAPEVPAPLEATAGERASGGKPRAATPIEEAASASAEPGGTTRRVVVIGAGFGGINATRALARTGAHVTLIDRSNHHLFQPLLYQVATAALAPSDIASPIRGMLSRQRNVEVLLGEVDAIDPVDRTVDVDGLGSVSYDYLIVASGATSSWFGHADWAANSTSLKTIEDAEALRSRLLGAFEFAENRSHDQDAVRQLLTFIVVGGGPTGVELAGAIRELARYTLAHDFRHIRPDAARVILFEGGPTILAGFPERLVRYARSRLEALGVELRTGVQVEQIDAEGVVAGGQRIASANVFWCAGVAATPAAHWLGVAAGKHGTVQVGPDCSIPGHPEIFAIGDVASFSGTDGRPLPGVAPVAKQQGRYVARVIAARIAGSTPPGPFRYHDQGSLAIVGRDAAVASLPRLKLTGRLAWLMWSCVHLLLLNGMRNRVLVYVQWAAAWFTHGRGALLIDTDIAKQRQRQSRRAETPHDRAAAQGGD